MTAVEHELRPGDPSSVATARTAVAAALAEVAPHVCDDVVLATSELVTNAVAVARARIRLQVDVAADLARVSVWDDGPGFPVAAPTTPDRPHGRGLPIVGVVAARWGVEPGPEGKWVWAEFPVAVPASR